MPLLMRSRKQVSSEASMTMPSERRASEVWIQARNVPSLAKVKRGTGLCRLAVDWRRVPGWAPL